MDHNFIVVGDRFDFEITPNPDNWELLITGNVSFRCVSGKIYLIAPHFRKGTGMPVSDRHFFYRLFNRFDYKDEYKRPTIAEIRVAANSNYEFARSIYTDITLNTSIYNDLKLIDS